MLAYKYWCIGKCTHNETEKPVLHNSLILFFKTIHLQCTYTLWFINLSVLCIPINLTSFSYKEKSVCFPFRLQHETISHG